MSKNKDWRPTASLTNLRKRAEVLSAIRQFFNERAVLEVETPLLCSHTVTDPYIDCFSADFINHEKKHTYYLQSSPEYAMKRLLAAGSGPIFQITKAFRNGDYGKKHNPEFTMLEWYRPGFNHHDLMDETDALLQCILGCEPAERISYRDLFLQYCKIDVAEISDDDLIYSLKQVGISLSSPITNRDQCLQLLFSHAIEPNLGFDAPLFLYHFPVSQAALAKIHHDSMWPYAERFEVYIEGIELANGFHELQNAKEQAQRFIQDQCSRKSLDKFVPDCDDYFLDALTHGLPACSGIALGIDRLLMVMLNTKQIRDVMSFSWANA